MSSPPLKEKDYPKGSNVFEARLMEENRKLEDANLLLRADNNELIDILDRVRTTFWRDDNTHNAVEKYFDKLARKK